MKLAFHIWRCPEFVAYSRGLEGVLAHNSMDDRIGKAISAKQHTN